MGCHTWFRNSIADMPLEHLEKLREKHIKGIKNAYIYKCSCEDWINSNKKTVAEIERTEDKESDFYKSELSFYTKMGTKEYYEKARNKYVKDLEILQNPKATRKQLLRVFKRHDFVFELNKNATDGSYLLDDFGWGDNYRVSGNPYPCVVHHNAEEAIQWLESYDNGHNIYCDGKDGMCQDIKDIVTEFFAEYPNGTIHYG